MAGVLDSVDSRTRLAGHNRMELLLFRLQGKQRYGINVFKVQEVIRCPRLTHMPNSNAKVVGVAHLRNKTIPVMDLGLAISKQPITDRENSYVIVTEYNRFTQGFLVAGVDRITNMNWKDILPPPKGSGSSNYLTAVTHVDDEMISIIDVERVFADIMGFSEEVSDNVLQGATGMNHEKPYHVMVVDDSSVARNQVKRVLEKVGISCTLANDGQEGYEALEQMIADGSALSDKIALVISDIEMPRMDGYTLTTKIRQHPQMKDIYVMLHTSLSGVFNNSMVEQVGANHFVPKFKPNELAHSVINIVSNKDPKDGMDQVVDT